MSNSVTVSEAKFEEFLRTHGLPSERVVEANTPRPDYRVTVGKLLLVFEVKELSKDDNFMNAPFARWARLGFRNPMLRPALDRDTANSMLWPSLNHHMHGLPEAPAGNPPPPHGRQASSRDVCERLNRPEKPPI